MNVAIKTQAYRARYVVYPVSCLFLSIWLFCGYKALKLSELDITKLFSKSAKYYTLAFLCFAAVALSVLLILAEAKDIGIQKAELAQLKQTETHFIAHYGDAFCKIDYLENYIKSTKNAEGDDKDKDNISVHKVGDESSRTFVYINSLCAHNDRDVCTSAVEEAISSTGRSV